MKGQNDMNLQELKSRMRLPVIGSPLFIISNPDLVDRLEKDAPLNALDPETLYGGNEKGYTDYPTLAESAVAAQ